MGYTLASLEYWAKWWEQRAEIPEFSCAHAEGVAAYAHKQAAVRRILAGNFRILWARYLIGVTETEIAAAPPDVRKNSEEDSDDEPGESDEEEEEKDDDNSDGDDDGEGE